MLCREDSSLSRALDYSFCSSSSFDEFLLRASRYSRVSVVVYTFTNPYELPRLYCRYHPTSSRNRTSYPRLSPTEGRDRAHGAPPARIDILCGEDHLVIETQCIAWFSRCGVIDCCAQLFTSEKMTLNWLENKSKHYKWVKDSYSCAFKCCGVFVGRADGGLNCVEAPPPSLPSLCRS